ncbi:Eco57I restriction-modification methylase domain-containing protein [Actinomyces bowdenii]|uniref:site-specific DNA-methyltransferase (adenine-specific) n=1 Tax=Actinomyces bowdenii TaxID=131109 RepID=A0A853EKD8_9ACTO|nr:DNA methyltransferase [Actinomyces bowdenii]MBF0696358.1 N-6 DNA methylase [Actinomyces bowdenii]NYS68531.1 N-6 DNA methylase [Actinomyces bowdenii]
MSPRTSVPRGRAKDGAGGRAGGAGGAGSAGRSASQQHRQWLGLVDTEGPFLSVPVLTGLYPQGIPGLSREHPERYEVLRAAKPALDRAWDAWDADRESDSTLASYRRARDIWVGAVLTEVLGWGGLWATPQDRPALAYTYRAASDGIQPVTITPTGALLRGEEVGALVLVTDPADSLREVGQDGWATSPIDRMAAMLRAPGSACSIGVVTDGRWWAIVSAPPSGATASGIVDCQTWVEEPATRDAFLELLSVRRLMGGTAAQRLPRLFADSVLAAEEVTEALGTQVRRAVELIVSALSDALLDASERELPVSRESTERAALGNDMGAETGNGPLGAEPREVYEAVVTVMMRCVFLLFAEERGLLPTDSLYTAGYGLAGVLDELESRARDEGEESMDGTSLTWHRLLATARALHGGVNAEDMRIPAYGGSLFDPERFPFLTATDAGGTLLLTVSDRVMLHVLRSLQTASLKGQEARRLSFRDIDVEQIGYIYEGLLGYTCTRAEETTLGLLGKDGEEPEVPLSVLNELAEQHSEDADLAGAIIAWLKEDQPGAKPPTPKALAEALAAGDTLPDADRALLAVTRDEALLADLRPWIGAIRRDLRGRLVVIQRGGLVVTETPSRRNAGAHYTPRSLAEEVVRHALEPLVHSPGPHETGDRSQWQPVSSDHILDLHVADIACGSGAFLVAAARFLARELVEAWTREGALQQGSRPIDLERQALRQVVARCLYGVDINEMAVEMCKLSLWLVSLDKDKPFSFVDDKVFVGNSLLGLTDLRQLRAQHIDPGATTNRAFELDRAGTYTQDLDVDTILREVTERRRKLASEIDESDPARSTATKQRLQRANEQSLATLNRVADAIVAVGLDPKVGARPGKRLNEAYGDLTVALGRAFPAGGAGDDAMLEAILKRGLTPTVATDYERWHCLHWPLAVPEVMDSGGFDAIIGNPPFLGGQKLTGSMGNNVRDWFVAILAEGRRGSADLAAYFLLRAFSLLSSHGTLGLIATNTVAQGDTRDVGLDRMVEDGFTITRAIQSRAWPAKSANLEYAAVWGTRGRAADEAVRVCDDAPVVRISTLLEPEGRVSGKPERLAENTGIAFQGCIVLGKGFVLDPAEAQAWIAEDPRNAEVLFPYLNGEDLNSRPDCSPSRWVIDFSSRREEEASTYPLPYGRVLERVHAERQTKNIKAYRNYWWQFGAIRTGMRKAIADLDEVLVIARVSKAVMPMRVPTGSVMSEQVVVFSTGSYIQHAVLSSSFHQCWAIAYGSGMRSDPRYTPSDVFETFPRPAPTPELEAIGRTLDTERREIMLRRQLGLTKLYNLVNDPGLAAGADPDVDRMRAIHVELDAAVAAAYGWDDLDLTHGFHTYRKMTRWTVPPATRVEILDRLLEENHRRAAAEAAAPAASGRSTGGSRSRRGRRPAGSAQEATLDI